MIFNYKIKAFIFDLDGVITDTSSLHEKAWRKMAQEENIPFPEHLSDKLRGVSRHRSLELILESSDKTYTKEEFQALMDKKNNYYRQSLQHLGPDDKLPGASELLDLLISRGYKVAIASGSKNALLVIDKLEISHKIDAIVDGSQISKSKPDPEIFQIAAQKFGLAPDECVVIEDAASGVEAANAGGFVSIGIGPKSRFSDQQQPNQRFENLYGLLSVIV